MLADFKSVEGLLMKGKTVYFVLVLRDAMGFRGTMGVDTNLLDRRKR